MQQRQVQLSPWPPPVAAPGLRNLHTRSRACVCAGAQRAPAQRAPPRSGVLPAAGKAPNGADGLHPTVVQAVIERFQVSAKASAFFSSARAAALLLSGGIDITSSCGCVSLLHFVSLVVLDCALFDSAWDRGCRRQVISRGHKHKLQVAGIQRNRRYNAHALPNWSGRRISISAVRISPRFNTTFQALNAPPGCRLR